MEDLERRPGKSIGRLLLEMVVMVLVVAAAGGLGWMIGKGQASEARTLSTRLVEARQTIGKLREERGRLRTQVAELQEQTRVLADTDFEQELARREEAWKRKFNEVRIAAEVEKVRRVEKLERELRMLKMDERMRREMAEQGNDENVPEGVAKGLTPRARQVCAKILEWEGLEGEDFEAAKQRLVQELGARSLVRVKFGSGSAHVGRDDRAALEVAVQGTEEYSLLLAVGFADTGGDEELNRELGTQRAGNVAEVLREMVKQGQFVEPVYLGETERFGERVENRVVEVWELRR